MLEFNGKVSSKCKEYILKRERRAAFIATTITSSIFLIPVLIATFLWDWIAIIAVIPLILLVSFSFIRPSQKDCKRIIPKRIIIDSDTLTSEGDAFSYTRPISEVKKVVDMGEWYHIFFNYHYRNQRFVCQKDLIVQGSISDFEKLFANKLKKE